jgi:hypothetical protein
LIDRAELVNGETFVTHFHSNYRDRVREVIQKKKERGDMYDEENTMQDGKAISS